MGFEYDFGEDGAYGFWSATLPEARGKGLHHALMVAKAKFAKEKGARYLYSMVEFDNRLSYNIRVNMGYEPIYDIFYLKLFSINFLKIIDLNTRKSYLKAFYKQPRHNIKVI
jgi:GNAT superfamily N-acetyltransferase